LLQSGTDHGLSSELLSVVVQSLLRCIDDTHCTVRKQGVRGLGHLIFLWQQHVAESMLADEDLVLRHVLPSACRALSDANAAVQKEAVVAVQRACQVEDVPVKWKRILLRSSCHLHPLVDAEDVALRGACLDLLGRLCALALEESEETRQPLDNDVGVIDVDDTDGDFSGGLELLLVHCVVRLEDTSSAVSSAAGRCLQHLVGILLRATPNASTEAAELLRRREQEQTDFEQFVFPFVALVHRAGDPNLVVRRLEICRTYFAVGPGVRGGGSPGGSAPSGAPANASIGSSLSLPTCVAAGFVAAAFVRCLGTEQPRPSALLCSVCRDLMDLIVVEDSDFRAQIARILGFFDILTHPGHP